MAKDKKHHFVPICYLNHFKQNGHLHYYSKKRQDENFSSVTDICQETYFYLITQKSWWKTFEIEKNFFSQNVENPLGPMIAEIVETVSNSISGNNSNVKS